MQLNAPPYAEVCLRAQGKHPPLTYRLAPVTPALLKVYLRSIPSTPIYTAIIAAFFPLVKTNFPIILP